MVWLSEFYVIYFNMMVLSDNYDFKYYLEMSKSEYYFILLLINIYIILVVIIIWRNWVELWCEECLKI